LKTENLLKSRLGDSSLPQVAGVLSSLPENYLTRIKQASPDLVELRIDQMTAGEDWLAAGRKIEGEKIPVLGTLRLKTEGGAWPASDEERLPLLNQALGAFSAIDVELASPLAERLAPVAHELGKVLILSHHNFAETESLQALRTIVERARHLGGVPKVATMVKSSADIETLLALLKETPSAALCVIGMGPLAEGTRIEFPARGSCITYGYLDRPSAPGQPSAEALVRDLSARISAYRDYRKNH
jgi:3-dehydroquinate dehydratase-1